MRISDWSSDVCSSDLHRIHLTEYGTQKIFTEQHGWRPCRNGPARHRSAGQTSCELSTYLYCPEWSGDSSGNRFCRPGKNQKIPEVWNGTRGGNYSGKVQASEGIDRKSTRLNSSH